MKKLITTLRLIQPHSNEIVYRLINILDYIDNIVEPKVQQVTVIDIDQPNEIGHDYEA